MEASGHKAEEDNGEVFCLKRAPVRGRDLDAVERRGEEVTGLRQ